MSRRLRLTAGMLCALVVLVLSAAALAADGDGDGDGAPVAERAAETKDNHQSDNPQLGYLLLGSSMILGLALAGGYYYMRRRRRRRAYPSFGRSPSRNFVGSGGRDLATRAMWRSVEVSSNKSVMISEGASEDLAPDKLISDRLGVVGFVPQGYHQSQNTGRDRAERLDQMACTGCGRRYARRVEFCYFDGLPLDRDTRQKRSEAPSFKACDSCGWEGDSEASACPNDGAELVEVDPTETAPIAPAIPMTVCPKCRHHGAPGQAFCPEDGEVLMPMVSVRLAKSPPRGFGPRRKVCNECGGEFSGHARFCSQDGSKLVALN
ncbi:MAG: hypothetical protein ACLFVJ_15265 [Persicimonas sp.]